MKNNKFTNKMCFGLILTTIAIALVGHYGVINTHNQSSTATAASMAMNNTITTTPQQQQQQKNNQK
jgi:hypothetical protein